MTPFISKTSRFKTGKSIQNRKQIDNCQRLWGRKKRNDCYGYDVSLTDDRNIV